jgi:hypothetical protein
LKKMKLFSCLSGRRRVFEGVPAPYRRSCLPACLPVCDFCKFCLFPS